MEFTLGVKIIVMGMLALEFICAVYFTEWLAKRIDCVLTIKKILEYEHDGSG